jgi:hypothetical protein
MKLWLLLALAACTSGKQVRATVLDAQGRPIAGAVIYWEAYQPFSSAPDTTFDFAFAQTGADGAPAQPRSLRWKWNAKLVVCALADGYTPQVIYFRGGPLLDEALIDAPVFHLVKGPAWDADLAALSFPFLHDVTLAARAALPEAAPLRKAFSAAAAQMPAGAAAAEREKKAAIERLAAAR